MFAVIYEGTLKAGMEEQYKACWRTVADYFIQEAGALGSCLHKTHRGTWLAYSRWPDKATRDKAWPESALPRGMPVAVEEAIKGLKACLEEQLPEIRLTVVEDML